MPTKIEKDTFSGRDTTGHEWDGIRELNTPLPKWWVYVFAASVVCAVVLMILYPSVPYIVGHTNGLLGFNSRAAVATEVKAMVTERSVFMDKIAKLPIEKVKDTPDLDAMALHAGSIAFKDNCQPCHGAGGGGRPGYPNLDDDVWLWGGKLADIQRTITYGIRSGDPDARESAMPRFGADGILKPEQIQHVADYVWTLWGHTAPAASVAAGKALYADNCAACHGDKGQGNRMMGAPPLRSHIHLYGETRDVIVNQVTNPRMGVMPNWDKRLDLATIKSLTLYVHTLGGGE